MMLGLDRMIAKMVAIVAIVILSPVLLICLALIYFNDKGNPLFTQERVGQFEAVFVLYKLRTMSVDTRHGASHEVGRDTITSIGRFLRSSKLDELPQLWNVVNGTMAFVGPRPSLASQSTIVKARRGRGVYRVLPGITGLAQVNKVDMSDVNRLVDYDSEYVETHSLSLDMKLIWQTLLGNGSGDRAV